MSKQAVKLAEELLDRFFRDAEGRTNRQLDVYFTLQDMDLSRDKAEPALEELVRRGLLNTFGPDIAFLTDAGVAAATNDQPIESIGPMERPFQATDKELEAADVSPPEPEPPASEAPVEGGSRIVHIGMEGSESTVPLSWNCSIGRSEDNDIVVNDKRASKRHAEIRYENQGHTLYDLDSANGTLLNGEYVVDPVVLKPDDEVVIGRTLLLYQATLPAPEPSAPRPGLSGTPAPSTPSMDIEGTELPTAAEPPAVVPEALLVKPSPEPEPEIDDPATLTREEALEPEGPIVEDQDGDEPELLDPEALEPLGEEEELDRTPPSAEIPRFPADPPAAEATSWVPEPELPHAGDAFDEDEAEATIMTTREAIFGEASPPGPEESSGDQETLPPGHVAPPREMLARVEPEPALLAFLSMLRGRVENAPVRDRQQLLDAIDLLRGHPEVRDMIRNLEDEAS